ncbi:hypothetical protein Cgig2_019162 [Carnegiea gigantea]|uniref:Uncharacterized protein n=1 Tax=Carnegiea gigantea TaxID=171969 RepID=A0A9Q1JIR4_9CARY|nr:hypothetical protein Cgig2_019162 [Carnegiea gigantea]
MQLKEIGLWKLAREDKCEHCACGAFAKLWITPVNEEMGFTSSLQRKQVNVSIPKITVLYLRSTMKFRRASKRRVRSSVQKGERSSHAKGHLKESVMDKELQISSGTEFLPKETRGSLESICCRELCRLSHAKGHLKGSVMDKELQISSETEFLPTET